MTPHDLWLMYRGMVLGALAPETPALLAEYEALVDARAADYLPVMEALLAKVAEKKAAAAPPAHPIFATLAAFAPKVAPQYRAYRNARSITAAEKEALHEITRHVAMLDPAKKSDLRKRILGSEQRGIMADGQLAHGLAALYRQNRDPIPGATHPVGGYPGIARFATSAIADGEIVSLFAGVGAPAPEPVGGEAKPEIPVPNLLRPILGPDAAMLTLDKLADVLALAQQRGLLEAAFRFIKRERPDLAEDAGDLADAIDKGVRAAILEADKPRDFGVMVTPKLPDPEAIRTALARHKTVDKVMASWGSGMFLGSDADVRRAIEKVKREMEREAEPPPAPEPPSVAQDESEPPVAGVDPLLWTLEPEFGAAGGPMQHRLTRAGLDDVAQAVTNLPVAAIWALEATPKTGTVAIEERGVGSNIRLTTFGEKHGGIDRFGVLTRRGFAELVPWDDMPPSDRSTRLYRLTEKGRRAQEEINEKQERLLQRVKAAHPILEEYRLLIGADLLPPPLPDRDTADPPVVVNVATGKTVAPEVVAEPSVVQAGVSVLLSEEDELAILEAADREMRRVAPAVGTRYEVRI